MFVELLDTRIGFPEVLPFVVQNWNFFPFFLNFGLLN